MKPYVQVGLFQVKNLLSWDFLVIQQLKNQPCNAGDMGSVPGQGTKISHAVEQWSPCNYWACVMQLESLCAEMKDLIWHKEDFKCCN